MAVLPTQGGSSGTWGTELNAFLAVALDANTGNAKVTESLKSSSYTVAVTDNGMRLVATTASIIITVPAAGTFTPTNSFECEVLNDSSGSITLRRSGTTDVTMAIGDIATVIEANGKWRVAKGTTTQLV